MRKNYLKKLELLFECRRKICSRILSFDKIFNILIYLLFMGTQKKFLEETDQTNA